MPVTISMHACLCCNLYYFPLTDKKGPGKICEGLPAKTYKLECVDSSLKMSCEDF